MGELRMMLPSSVSRVRTFKGLPGLRFSRLDELVGEDSLPPSLGVLQSDLPDRSRRFFPRTLIGVDIVEFLDELCFGVAMSGNIFYES